MRKLEKEEALDDLLSGISESRRRMQDLHGYTRPIALKISPDLSDRAIPAIAELLRKYEIDALIATNTTLKREAVAGHRLAGQAGGLSGLPLSEQSKLVLQSFHQELKDSIPIISVGGIESAAEAQLRFQLGAQLIQLYSGLIYRGPGLIKDIARNL